MTKSFTYKGTYGKAPNWCDRNMYCRQIKHALTVGDEGSLKEAIAGLMATPFVNDGIKRIRVSTGAVARYLYQNNEFRALELMYPDVVDRRQPNYSTAFGPIFHGDWVIYDNTVRNLDRAHTRITACREAPFVPPGLTTHEANLDYELTLQAAQQANLTNGHNVYLHAILKRIKLRLNEKLSYLDYVAKMINTYALLKHPKRKIRIKAMNDLIANANDDSFGTYTEKITGKLKTCERAKPGKYPRLIGDYSTPGSLLGGYLCEVAKSCFGEFDSSGTLFKFAKTSDPESLDEVGLRLRDDVRDSYFYHSDDSIMKIGGRFFEMDISSCDTSNGPAVFDTVKQLFSDFPQFHDVIGRTVRQCRNRVTLRHPQKFSAKIHLNPVRVVEYSGTVLTTLLNNLATLSIMMSIHRRQAQSTEEISQAAIAVGYVVTVAERPNLERCQFLKHSWYTNMNGEPKSFLNLGPILRSFGSCRRDLPGRGDIVERARKWNSSSIKAYMHAGENRLLRSLRSVYGDEGGVLLPYDITKHCDGQRRGVIPDEAYLTRYQMTCNEWETLCNVAGDYAYATFRLTAINKIYQTDYGLDPNAPLERSMPIL